MVDRIRTAQSSYQVLYSFANTPDGRTPEGGLIDVNGVLYGTTAYGGNFRSKAGTVFSITTGGTERVLHSFGRIRKGKRDGKVPVASLIDVGGVFYGTTVNGGAYDDEQSSASLRRAESGYFITLTTVTATPMVHALSQA